MAGEGDGAEEKTIVVGAGEQEGQIVVAGAAYEEEEVDGGGGAAADEESGGGDGQFIIPPPGFRFRPSDDELIRYYLLPKLQGRGHAPNRAIIEHNVYQCHPDELTGKYRGRGEGKSFYFLSPRVRRYDNGDRPRRDTDDGRGRWKVSTGKKDMGEEKKVAGDGTTRYCMSVLNYFESPRGGGRKSEWLMRELTVPAYEIKLPKDGGPGGKTLDRYVMCKIYLKDDKGDDDEEAGPSSASPLLLHGPVEGDEGATSAELPKLSKKMAGKRPAQDQQPRNAAATARKRAHHSSKCMQIEPPAPSPQGNGMQAPFSTPGCSYYGGSGQPMLMGCHAGTPMPRPMLAYNNGQVQVPRQQVAYNGQVPVMARQPAAYNGPVPVMARQPAAYNGPVPVRQQQVAFNGQVRPPPCRPAGCRNVYGQNPTMMTRPSCPAPVGQAVNPQVQKQPETDEMREKRVLQQNLQEHLRMQSQQQLMGFTQQQQQQQLAMASTHQQRQAMAFMMRQQQQWRMSFMMHQQQQQYHQQQQQQQQYLGGANADYYHHEGAMVLPTASSSPGEAALVTADGSPVSTVVSVEGNEEGNNGDCSSHGRGESAGGVTAPASAPAEGDGPQHA
ncbi:hypothetical protein CFC21_084403 [Triticum aestivum]|uniref:NAC domain-containing protein n=2 Tax=Triticum aestivum TaxID=4565 RepID=A0A3B6NTS9_WHEAT|nr:chromatin modification-related protein eaf-1-like [Triticum aestivum]KAF7080303.1 hypothetical protein CFC21_084403 [Triticum aestivum]